MYYLYILYSESADKYYVGHSADPWLRIQYHNSDQKGTYSSKHRPWMIVALFEAGQTRGEAFRIEQFLKRQKSRLLISKLLNPDFIPEGQLAQLVRVPHVRD